MYIVVTVLCGRCNPTNHSPVKQHLQHNVFQVAAQLFPLISATDHLCSSLTGYRRLINGMNPCHASNWVISNPSCPSVLTEHRVVDGTKRRTEKGLPNFLPMLHVPAPVPVSIPRSPSKPDKRRSSYASRFARLKLRSTYY